MVKCCKKSCSYIKEVMNLYALYTNQKINFNKSECFFPSAYPKAKKEAICELLGIEGSPLPLKYLGDYINKGKIPVNIQRQMISKAKNKLECWASKNVSQAGKIVLLNLVINSIPMHTLATTWIIDGVVKDYEKLARRCFWKSGSSKKGFHLVSWKKVSLSGLKGGLGIRDLKLVKVSIHAKILLALLNKKNVSWATLLNQRYKSIHPWTKNYGKNKNWAVKGIFTAMFMLRDGLKKRIGNGCETNVWSDPWIECLPLERWPTFINMEMINEVHKVSDLINDKEWNLVLIKQDDEKAFDTPFEWRRLWNLKVLPKVKVFIWKLVQGKLPTSCLLSKRSNIPEHCCFVCNKEMDNADHIFFKCAYANRLWTALESILGSDRNCRYWIYYDAAWVDPTKKSDCKFAIDILKRSSKPPWYVKSLVVDILHLVEILEVCSWCFIKREDNMMAHYLAKAGLIDMEIATDNTKIWSCYGDSTSSATSWRCFLNNCYMVASPKLLYFKLHANSLINGYQCFSNVLFNPVIGNVMAPVNADVSVTISNKIMAA
ncbi:hypothetical protein Cni_G06656 [Canna indica]|uniref:Reverse transcriptase zinc-binding domain-containing protein n=1 Tax=Canna indica TaxID=4628 RepID=A0AAQ3JYY5_9LILI|nr:hypothetical protein Cni_G06656 [Canna indica]